MPILVTGDYFFGEPNGTRPFLGIGAGTYWTEDRTEAGVFRAMLALNALDYMDERAASVEDEIRALPKQDDGVPQRMRAYVQNLIAKTLADLE